MELRISNIAPKKGEPKEMNGGDLYGKGAKGQVYDLACVDAQSVCAMLAQSLGAHGFPEIEVLTINNRRHRLSHDEALRFFAHLSAAQHLVVKEFTRSKHAVSDFSNELDGIRQLHRIFGTNLQKFTTVATLPDNIVGFTIDHRRHFVLSRKCGQNLYSAATHMSPTDYRKMLEDVLETLAAIQKKDFYHMDLKPDNIIWCEDTRRYTVIDWERGLSGSTLKRALLKGAASSTAETPYGSNFTASPIALQIYTGKPTTAKYASSLVVYGHLKHMEGYNISIPAVKEFIKFRKTRVYAPIKALLQTSPSRESLYERFHQNFDVFSLGITIAILAISRNLPRTFLSLAESFVAVNHPLFAVTPQAALENVRRFLGPGARSKTRKVRRG